MLRQLRLRYVLFSKYRQMLRLQGQELLLRLPVSWALCVGKGNQSTLYVWWKVRRISGTWQYRVGPEVFPIAFFPLHVLMGCMPMLSSHSEQSMSEHIASRRRWRSLICRTLCLHCQRCDSKEAVRAQAACPGAWRKGFSGSGEALNLFFFGHPQKWSDST